MRQSEKNLSYDWSLLAGRKVTEWFHCHPVGLLYPSWGDFEALSYRYAQGVLDVSRFSYGVVSIYGCIAFVISSEEHFVLFADKVNNKDVRLQNQYEDITKGPQMGVSDMLNRIVQFISQTDSGLEALYIPYIYEYLNGEDMESWGDWEAKTLSGEEAVAKDCK